jgi:divalent metal cation (Fe/Co/Zn/Cd) transporter
MDARWKRTADPEADLNRLRRRGVWLWAASIVLTLAVAVAAIAAGIVASSIALIGLGLESAIELVAAAIVVWQLRSGRDTGENWAAGLIAVMFLAGAAYLAAESIHEMASHLQSAHSAAGLAISSAALVVLAVLALAKRRVGLALGSVTLRADAAETGLSALAAAAALLGAGLDDWLGWWWTVPVGGLAIAALAIIEGIHTWRHRGRW